MIPGRLFADPRSAAMNVSAFAIGSMAMFATFPLVIQYLSHDLGESPVAARVATLPWTIMPFLVSPFAGRLGRRVSPALLTAVGLAVLGVGVAGFAFALDAGATAAQLVPAGIVTGLGVALALPNMAAVAIGSVEPRDIGKASGMLNTSRQIGAVFGVAVGVAIAQATGSFSTALIVAAGVALVGAVAGGCDRFLERVVVVAA
jgi:MFS family permease